MANQAIVEEKAPWPSSARTRIEFKRQVVQDFLGDETLYGLAERHEISRTLIHVWLAKHEAGVLDCDTAAASALPAVD
jgi:transposase